ncbi:hypothetical protein ACWDUI_19160, partial [Streptosporangium sandarakinum]
MRMLAAAVLLLLATACGPAQAPVTAEEFADRAREVAEHWRASAEQGPWRAGMKGLRGVDDPMDLAEVTDIYLPLTRLL